MNGQKWWHGGWNLHGLVAETRVEHPQFGAGLVLGMESACDGPTSGRSVCGCIARVAFTDPQIGTKRLLLGYAPLKVLPPGPRFDSPAEESIYSAIVEVGIPKPEVQYRVDRGGGRHYRLDFAYPQIRLAVEVDGLAFHGSQKSFIEDQQRQRQLQMAGWVVVRFAAAEALRRPHYCVGEIARMMMHLSAR